MTLGVAMRDLLLIGGGHSHALVLREFALQPLPPDVRVRLLTNIAHAPYSGMLPGYVAGHYGAADVHIDLKRLAHAAGAALHIGMATGIDRSTRRVLCSDGRALPYDLLSINIGSAPQRSGVEGAAEHSTPVKPQAAFEARWQALLAQVREQPTQAVRVAVVGGGAGGVELLLAMQHRLTRELLARGVSKSAAQALLRFDLLTQSPTIMPTHSEGVQQRFSRVLARRGVAVHSHAEVVTVRDGQVVTRGGLALDVDVCFWVTQAGAAPWLQQTGLALDAKGFIQVNDHLQSVNDPRIFAAGDTAAMTSYPLEKAGVVAVRQARSLAANLRYSLAGQALQPYHPQRRWLALISTGNRYAVASYGDFGFAGAWVWQVKNLIDRRFMRRFVQS